MKRTAERPWWQQPWGLPPWLERWQARRHWYDGLQPSRAAGRFIVGALLAAAVAVIAGYTGEAAGADHPVFFIAVGAVWAVAAVVFVVAVGVTSRRSGRSAWRVIYDSLRAVLRLIFEVG